MTKDEIKERREKLGLRQTELGAELDVSGNTVSRWELGESEPESPGMLDKALKWLELSKALRDDPFLDSAEAKLAQMKTKLEAERKRLRGELSARIAKVEADPKLAADLAGDLVDMKADLAELS